MKEFKTYLTFLSRNKLFTVVNLAGLSISLMFVLLISNMVIGQFTVDKDMKDVDRIYLLATDNSVAAHYNLGDKMQSKYPEIEEWCAVSYTPGNAGDSYVEVEGERIIVNRLLVRDNFFEMFGFRLIEGNPSSVLSDKYSVVLTKSAVNKLFRGESPVGKKLKMNFNPQQLYTVSGVMEDISNSVFPEGAEIVLPYDAMEYINKYAAPSAPEMNSIGGTDLLYKLNSNSDICRKTEDVNKFLKETDWRYKWNEGTKASWIKLKDFYSSDIISNNLNRCSSIITYIYMTIGLLILIMAVLNYIGMSIAQTSYRAKEMATRRLLGSLKQNIFWRMIAESFILTFVAFVLGFILALYSENIASRLFQVHIDLIKGLNVTVISVYLLFLLLLSVLSGIIPGVILSKYHPMDVVKGTFRRKTKMIYLRILFIFQVGLTMALLSCSFFINRQMNHIFNEPLGYKYGNVLCYQTIGDMKELLRFRNEVSQMPNVRKVCFTRGMPVDRGYNNTSNFQVGDSIKRIPFQIFEADSSFLSIFSIPVIEDRHMSGDDVYMLSNNGFYETGTDFDAEKIVSNGGWNIEIGGRYQDFVIGTVMSYQCPTVIQIKPVGTFYPWDILVEVSGEDIESVRKDIDELYSSAIRSKSFSSVWYSDLMKMIYEPVACISDILFYFTCAAIVISVLGLTSMSMYFISQRKRDIAIRKAFGSDSTKEMLSLLRFAFISIIFGLVIAIPAMCLGMYVLKSITMYSDYNPWWTGVVGIFIVIFVSLLSVWIISLKAVKENPVNNLKKE